MTRPHHFHLDAVGHSLTVNIHAGLHGDAELLVDGKETGRTEVYGNRPLIMSGELPTGPPRQLSVRIMPGPGAPRCAAVIDGKEQWMSPPRILSKAPSRRGPAELGVAGGPSGGSSIRSLARRQPRSYVSVTAAP
ncbi:hypothetical protein [Streptomyces sp. TN58]|uniref:hypothetical protein n=1 Tax=Streptomyces sp. TN58 TaxID=234612 RepID=UPI0009506FA4|nr:hypothetical protein [Streptomyces sp. TN58]APU43339.1 hypothetical protein BSL84_29810 [Streptomyces sp. TN58]